jgi:hypothetical protein
VYLKLNILYFELNYFDVPCYISFKERLPDDGHSRWPKHVVYNNINLRFCIYHQYIVVNHLKSISVFRISGYCILP